MGKPRKTIHLRELLEWVNQRNATSTCLPSVREGWNSLVNSMLMQADAYIGFQFLTAEDLADNAKGLPPGIIWNADGTDRHTFPDETRIRYYVRKGI